MNLLNETITQPIELLEEQAIAPHPDPFADWVTITRFEVLVNKRSKFNARVYANGRQQVPVEIIIQARDANGVQVNLSADQLRSIKLIDYHTSAATVDASRYHYSQYIYQWDPIGVAGIEGDGRDEDALPGESAQSEVIYVTKFDVSTTKVAAEITSPSGGVFRTNTPNPPVGKFDSWVNVQAVEQIRYDHTDLSMERVDEVSNPIWDVDLYYIRFNVKEFQIVASEHFHGDGDTPHLNMIHNGNQSRMHIAFSAGEKRKITFAPNGSVPGVSFEVNKRIGEATAARCIVQRSLYYQERRAESCVVYRNQYGNGARCGLGNTYTDDYNMISLGRILHE